eukprot:2205223-Rhodomonas_salina.2
MHTHRRYTRTRQRKHTHTHTCVHTRKHRWAHLLESPRQSWVLLDVLAVLAERRRAHTPQLPARQRLLQHTSRSAARAHHVDSAFDCFNRSVTAERVDHRLEHLGRVESALTSRHGVVSPEQRRASTRVGEYLAISGTNQEVHLIDKEDDLAVGLTEEQSRRQNKRFHNMKWGDATSSISRSTPLTRSSNSPRYLAPATRDALCARDVVDGNRSHSKLSSSSLLERRATAFLSTGKLTGPSSKLSYLVSTLAPLLMRLRVPAPPPEGCPTVISTISPHAAYLAWQPLWCRPVRVVSQ